MEFEFNDEDNRLTIGLTPEEVSALEIEGECVDRDGGNTFGPDATTRIVVRNIPLRAFVDVFGPNLVVNLRSAELPAEIDPHRIFGDYWHKRFGTAGGLAVRETLSPNSSPTGA